MRSQKPHSHLVAFTYFFAAVLVMGVILFFVNQNTVIASGTGEEVARCTGSAYCRACRNCSRCGHCNSGGSCGVCSRRHNIQRTVPSGSLSYPRSSSSSGSGSGRTGTSRSAQPSSSTGSNRVPSAGSTKPLTSTSANSSARLYNLPNDRQSKNYLKTLIVNTTNLNLRTGPGTGYSVLKTVQKYTELTFLAQTGDWVKVRVKGTGEIGFVHKAFVGGG